MSNTGLPLFDTFNAKYLSYREIAETYIYNHQFDELIKNNHSLLMGPRGSGKTTMLKMLTPMGLYYWHGDKSEEIKGKIPFTSIYIPTDIQWKRQVDQLKDDLVHFPKYSKLISRILVTVNIQIAVIATFKSLFEISSSGRDSLLNNESRICEKLISQWKFQGNIAPNFLAIELALIERVAEIKNHVQKVIYVYKHEGEIEYPNYFFDDYLDQVRFACKVFENEFERTGGPLNSLKRWALCFDELEIAPKWLQLELINHLRGKDENILFKLTTSPIVSLYNETEKEYYSIEAQEDNDFKVIRIWLHNLREKTEWISFGNELINQRLKRIYNNEVSVKDIFGEDKIERAVIQELEIGDKKSAIKTAQTHERGSLFWHLFKEVAARNSSFKKFLLSKDIDPKDPVPISDAQVDSVFRKVKQLVSYRYILTKEKSHVRSRKVIPLFYGIPYLFQITDGNPRLLIGLIDELLANGGLNDKGELKSYPINLQSRVALNISNRFIEQIDNHPEANKLIGNKPLYLGDIIRTIGKFFYKEMMVDDFRMDPRNTFIVDSIINQKFIDLIQLALQLGIIIYVNPKEAISQKGLLNKEFRLNYLLSPYFKILAREYDRPVKLSQIFSGSSPDQQKLIFE